VATLTQRAFKMDQVKLDRVARAAGIIKNRIGPGETVAVYDERGYAHKFQMSGLHEIAVAMLDVVAFVREALDEAHEFMSLEPAITTSITTDEVPENAADDIAAAFCPSEVRSATEQVVGEYRNILERVDPEWFKEQKYGRFRPCGPDSRFNGIGVIDDETE
jgi:hypothetical protein